MVHLFLAPYEALAFNIIHMVKIFQYQDEGAKVAWKLKPRCGHFNMLKDRVQARHLKGDAEVSSDV